MIEALVPSSRFLRRAVPLLFFGGFSLVLARASHHDEPDDDGAVFQAAGLRFVLPANWIARGPEDSVRAGDWSVPARPGATGEAGAADEGELVVFYFGPGTGGSAQENIDGWRGTILDADGHPAAGEVKTGTAGGLKITELVAFGAYNDPVPIPGLPPVIRPGYGLIGAVVEGPQGNLYWRFTGPAPLVTATLPLLRRILDGVKPQGG